MSWSSLFNNSRQINKQGIYLVPAGTDSRIVGDRILKVKDYNVQCLQHEYLVGIKLNNYSHKHGFAIQTYDYGIEDGRGYLLLEAVPGITLHQQMAKLTDFEQRLKLLYQLFLEIEQIGRLCPFTHYDIHLANIHVQELERPIRKRYQPQKLAPIELETKFQLYLLDYAYSHHSDVRDTWVEVKATSICSGSIPSVYDPVYDLYAVLNKAQYYLHQEDEALEQTMLEDKFVAYIGDRKQTVVWGRVGKEFIYELLPVPEHTLFDRVFYNSSASEEGQYQELLRPIVSSRPGQSFSKGDEPVAKQIGRRLRYIKQKCITSRKHDRSEVVQLGILFFQRLIATIKAKPPRLEFQLKNPTLRFELNNGRTSKPNQRSRDKPSRSTTKPTRGKSRSTVPPSQRSEWPSDNRSTDPFVTASTTKRKPKRNVAGVKATTRTTDHSDSEWPSERKSRTKSRSQPSRVDEDSPPRRSKNSTRSKSKPFVTGIKPWDLSDDDGEMERRLDLGNRAKPKKKSKPIKVQFKSS